MEPTTAAVEYLIVAVIVYFILQTAGNLVLIMRGGPAQPSVEPEPDHDWSGPRARQYTGSEKGTPQFWGEDVEDATWEDVEEA